MSELCNFPSLLMSDLILLCSFILSHPLYFSYFIFFAPYLIKLVSFLSPLFITTFLVSLAFLTGFVHENISIKLAYTYVVETLQSKKDFENGHEFQCLDDLGMYEILFGSSTVMDVRENPVEFLEEKSAQDCLDKEDLGKSEDFAVNKVEKDSVFGNKVENSCVVMEEKRLENFLKILGEFERLASNVEEKKKLFERGAKADKVVEKQSLLRNGSEARGSNNKVNDDNKVVVNNNNNNNNNDSNGGGKECTSMVKAHSQRIITSNVDDENEDDDDKKSALKAESCRALDVNSLGSYGSMRKEKEWKRTLACKLFEERHNVDGGEGMDSLWEAYEMDSNKQTTTKQRNERKSKSKSKKKCDEDEEEEEIEGQLCCLQALKLSTGKMSFGMGRPNLVKISKAIKGIGWLHQVTKHSKKVHNNGDRY